MLDTTEEPWEEVEPWVEVQTEEWTVVASASVRLATAAAWERLAAARAAAGWDAEAEAEAEAEEEAKGKAAQPVEVPVVRRVQSCKL